MDPISITTGVIALITTVGKLSVMTEEFISSCREARSDMLAVDSELTTLTKVLKLLKDDIDSTDPAEFPEMESFMEEIAKLVGDCQRVADRIRGVLVGYEGKMGAVKWAAFGRRDILGLKDNLAAYSRALQVTMDMMNLLLVKSMKSDVKAVVQGQDVLKTGQEELKVGQSEIKTGQGEIKTGQEDIRLGQGDIKNAVDEILARIEELKLRAPGLAAQQGETNFIMERYLDSLTTYAETVIGDDPTLVESRPVSPVSPVSPEPVSPVSAASGKGFGRGVDYEPRQKNRVQYQSPYVETENGQRESPVVRTGQVSLKVATTVEVATPEQSDLPGEKDLGGSATTDDDLLIDFEPISQETQKPPEYRRGYATASGLDDLWNTNPFDAPSYGSPSTPNQPAPNSSTSHPNTPSETSYSIPSTARDEPAKRPTGTNPFHQSSSSYSTSKIIQDEPLRTPTPTNTNPFARSNSSYATSKIIQDPPIRISRSKSTPSDSQPGKTAEPQPSPEEEPRHGSKPQREKRCEPIPRAQPALSSPLSQFPLQVSGPSGTWVLCSETIIQTWDTGAYVQADIITGNATRRRSLCRVIPRLVGPRSTASSQDRKPAKLRSHARRNAMILNLLDHQNIVKLADVIELDSHWYFMYTPFDGVPLVEEVALRGRYPEPTARKMARQLASALHYCLLHSIAHASVNPENVLVDEHADIKLTDFSMAGFKRRAGSDILSGSGVGRRDPSYVDPAAFTYIYNPHFDADAWGFGLVLYTMLCGRLPFGENDKKALPASYPVLLSTACQALLSSTLQSRGSKRPTMRQISEHPWMTEREPTQQPLHLPKRHPLLPPFDTETITHMPAVLSELGKETRSTAPDILPKLTEKIESKDYREGISYYLAPGKGPWKPGDRIKKEELRDRRLHAALGTEPAGMPAGPWFLEKNPLHFHPLVMIYFLVRERLEREGKGLDGGRAWLRLRGYRFPPAAP